MLSSVANCRLLPSKISARCPSDDEDPTSAYEGVNRVKISLYVDFIFCLFIPLLLREDTSQSVVWFHVVFTLLNFLHLPRQIVALCPPTSLPFFICALRHYHLRGGLGPSDRGWGTQNDRMERSRIEEFILNVSLLAFYELTMAQRTFSRS
jgi:hypothetical protein